MSPSWPCDWWLVKSMVLSKSPSHLFSQQKVGTEELFQKELQLVPKEHPTQKG